MNWMEIVELDGESLTAEKLQKIEVENVQITVSAAAWERVRKGRQVVEDILEKGDRVYGINTGFGSFATVAIDTGKLSQLQENLIRSHASGVGQPLSPQRARKLLALRINVLAKGYSGVRPETLQHLIDACNRWCIPFVPEKGTLGASGDLAPLSHLALGLMGEGSMWHPKEKCWKDAAQVLASFNLKPITLTAKEGLALINGTQLITCLGAEALARAQNLAVVADIVGAMTLEGLKGTGAAFDAAIHNARPHKGQLLTAARLRLLLNNNFVHPSDIRLSHKNCGNVQDAYTLRCMPQVHGVSNDTIEFVRGIIETEINSATDNPMVFFDGRVISGGNFHGEYPAKALDYLAIAVHEFGSISERRIERLVNGSLSGLPAFLVQQGGLNSGFMIAHCTAAALLSENKGLCHPSSVDSISTSAAKEDHVSMGGWAARKALSIVENVETILAIELLCACQAIDFLRPLTTTEALERVHTLVRTKVKFWDQDRYMKPDIDAATELIRSGKVVASVAEYLARIHEEPGYAPVAENNLKKRKVDPH